MKTFRIFSAELLAGSLLFLTACSRPSNDPLDQLISTLGSHATMHYLAEEHSRYSWSPDTIVTPYEVWVVRDSSYRERGGYIWADNHYRPYHMICHDGQLWLTIPPKHTTVHYADFSEPLIAPVDWIDIFLRPDTLRALKDTAGVDIFLSDTLWEGRKARALQIVRRTDGSSSRSLFVLAADQPAPLYARYEEVQNDQQYVDELFFSGVTFDDISLAELKEREEKVLKANPVEEGGGTSETARLERMLHVGDPAPLFEGTYYANGQPFALKDHLGRGVILLDFWYTHCPPCVRAIPALSGLYREMKDQGLIIFGLNSVDNRPRSRENLERFIRKRGIPYDIILTRPEVDLRYRINGYPSMYVIDRQGRIAWVEIGFSPEKFEELKARLQEMLQ